MIYAALAPYRFWIMLACVAALFGSGVYSGHRWATTQAEAARAKVVDARIAQLQAEKKRAAAAAAAQLAQLHAEIRRADAAAAALAATESRIVVKTIEVIRHVATVTTGTTHCLSGAAVRLLNYDTNWGPYEATGEPVAESPSRAAASDRDVAAASDRDVAMWIAVANQQYEVAAARLNALIEWNERSGQ